MACLLSMFKTLSSSPSIPCLMFKIVRILGLELGRIVQWLRALAVLIEDLSLVP